MQHQELFNLIFKPGANGDDPVIPARAAERFPWFGPAHFFSLAAEGSTGLNDEKKAGKATIHFSNPFLLYRALLKKNDIPSAVVPEIIVEQPQPGTTGIPAEKEIAGEKDTATEPSQKQEIIFEPLFVTDYFASQGIKLADDTNPTDKLGKQLRSFTDWLKTMKKVHESRLPAGNEQMDISVQRLAEKSNKENEVVTEAMAEAWVQQGKTAKAVDTYLKLSLLNPAKSAFFAAKIEKLNNS
jgi:ribosome-binding protein aMBF1 (putative translation factor)